MSEEWSDWIEHDGKGVPPALIGRIVLLEERSGEQIGPGVLLDCHRNAPHFISPKPDGRTFLTDIARYRVKKPRGLTILENLLADLPAPVKHEVEA